MGRMNAEGMADSGLPLRSVLHWHLTSNHFPPVPVVMIEPCMEAIRIATEADDYQAWIDLPAGVEYRGADQATVGDIIEAFHLDSFVGMDDGEGDDEQSIGTGR
jgi:hypothetical protein